jgi:hypothetical protein
MGFWDRVADWIADRVDGSYRYREADRLDGDTSYVDEAFHDIDDADADRMSRSEYRRELAYRKRLRRATLNERQFRRHYRYAYKQSGAAKAARRGGRPRYRFR